VSTAAERPGTGGIVGNREEPFYTARASVHKLQGVHRRARLETGTEVDFGVHGPVKAMYRLDDRDVPLPVDYIAAATGA
jgi:hypothetical protein